MTWMFCTVIFVYVSAILRVRNSRKKEVEKTLNQKTKEYQILLNRMLMSGYDDKTIQQRTAEFLQSCKNYTSNKTLFVGIETSVISIQKKLRSI